MKAADIIKACNEANEPHLAAGFIAAGITPRRLKARLEAVAEIRTIAAIACRVQPALPSTYSDELVALDVGVDEAKAIVAERLVIEQSPEICNSIPVDDAPKGHGWHDVIDKTTPSRLRPYLKG